MSYVKQTAFLLGLLLIMNINLYNIHVLKKFKEKLEEK